MALWEGASAWQLDPQTLSSMGPVDWKKSLTHAPFSAHPRPDRDGSLWNFGHVPWAGKLILYHIGHDGLLKRSAILNAPETGMVHDFAVTDRSLILVPPRSDMTRITPIIPAVFWICIGGMRPSQLRYW